MEREITPEQWAAIKHAIEIARNIQKENPEIAKWYREGFSQAEIAEKLGLKERYPISDGSAQSLVGYALRGYDGRFGGTNFPPLLSESELEALAKKHNSETGKWTYENKKALFSLTQEQLKAASKKGAAILKEKGAGFFDRENKIKGGKVAGSIIRNKKLGIFAANADEKKERSKKALIAQGKFPWAEREYSETYCCLSEKEFMLMLANSETYRHCRGRPNLQLIADAINASYRAGETIRTKKAVGTELKREGFKGKDFRNYKKWKERECLEDRCVYGELEFALMLANSPHYQHSHGQKGEPNWRKIVSKLNELYHEGKSVRYRDGLRNKLREYKKV